jgi:hypothetical protein
MSTKTQELVGLEELVIKNGNGNREVVSKVNKSGQLAETASPSLVEVTDEEVKAAIEAQLQAAYEKALATARKEDAEPYGWWDLYAIGPISLARVLWSSVPRGLFFEQRDPRGRDCLCSDHSVRADGECLRSAV